MGTNIEVKRDFIEALRAKLPDGTTIVETERLLTAFSETVSEAIAGGATKIVVPGIVKLEVVETKARTGRNPRTGADVPIPSGKRVKAKAASSLSKLVEA